MNSNSLSAIFVAAAASLVASAQSASGAVITFTQQSIWEFYSQGQGAALSLETFDSYGGFYTSPLTGTAGGVNWSASAAGGLFVGSVAGSPALSTNLVEPLTISFAGAPHLGPTVVDEDGTLQLLRCRRLLEGDAALRELPASSVDGSLG